MIESDGFTYLTCPQDGFTGRIRGSVVGLHSGTNVNLTSTLTGERKSLPMLVLKPVSRDEADEMMLARKQLLELRERVRIGKINRMKDLEAKHGLRAHAFESLQDAMVACAMLRYVSGEEPMLIASDIDRILENSREMDEDDQIEWEHIVMSSMLLLHAKFILLADDFAGAIPPHAIPWWWQFLEWNRDEAVTLHSKKPSYMQLLASAQSYGIIRRNGCAVERHLSLPLQDEYWSHIKQQYVALTAKQEADDEERARIDEESRKYD